MSGWGRDTASRSRRGRGFLGTLVLFVLGMLVGGWLYHYYQGAGIVSVVEGIVNQPPGSIDELGDRISTIGDTQNETLEAQNREIARLANERDQLERELEALRTEETDDSGARERIGDLEQQLGRTRASLELAERLNREIQAKLDLAEQVNNDLQSQLESGRVEGSPPARQGEEQSLREELERRTAQLEQRDELLANYDSEFVRLEGVAAELAERKQELEAARARIAALENEQSALQSAGERESRRLAERVSALREELASTKNELRQARAGEDADEALERARDRITELESEIRETNARAAASEARRAELEEGSNAVVEALKSELRDARERTSELQVKLEAAQNRQVEQVAEPADPAEDRSQYDLTPRDPLDVATAIQQSAGLQDIDDPTRDRIATRLIEGECVARILRDEFGRAPAVALRDLISSLDSDC